MFVFYIFMAEIVGVAAFLIFLIMVEMTLWLMNSIFAIWRKYDFRKMITKILQLKVGTEGQEMKFKAKFANWICKNTTFPTNIQN